MRSVRWYSPRWRKAAGHTGGGVTSYDRIRRDIRRLLLSNPRAVTTVFDVYGFPRDVPGFPNPWPAVTAERVKQLGRAIEQDIGDPRFFAGLIAHEFEGLLFSDPNALAVTLETGAERRPSLLKALGDIRAAVPTPEDIDDGPGTAPSKRLKKYWPRYNKQRHGPLAAEQMGLAVIRKECPLFSAWVARLEGLASPPPGRDAPSPA